MPFDPSRVRAIFFDVDGTLRDTDDEYVARFTRWLAYVRFLLPGRNAARAARWLVMQVETPATFLYTIPDWLHIDDEIARLGDWLAARRRMPKAHTSLLIPGVMQTLDVLSASYPLSVISARPARGTHAFLEEHRLTPYFQHIASAQTTPHTKPHPAPLLWCARQLNIPIEACLMVGDTTVDIRAGKRAGAQAVGVLSGLGEANELHKAGADVVLENVCGLLEILNG
jgi:phosphoglycolate phosphatase-like HAD superfamily hydrolase